MNSESSGECSSVAAICASPSRKVQNRFVSCWLNRAMAPWASSVARFAFPPSLACTMARASQTGIPSPAMSCSMQKPIWLSAPPVSRPA